jgi:hypothetical protein
MHHKPPEKSAAMALALVAALVAWVPTGVPVCSPAAEACAQDSGCAAYGVHNSEYQLHGCATPVSE